VWKRSLGKPVHSSPTVQSGVLYVGSADGSLYALHTSNGSIAWKFGTGGPITSSPAVFTQKNGTLTIYIGSGDTNVYAVRASDGHRLWAFKTGGAVESSPAVANWNGGDILVVGSNDLKFYGLDADTGAKKWVCATNGIAISSPALNVSLGRAYWGTNGWDIQGHNLIDGMTQWSYTCGAAVRTSPAVANGVVFGGCGKDQNIYALRETLKSSPGGAPQSPGGTENRVHRKIWNYDTGGTILSSPAVADAMVFIGSDSGYLYAFGLP
jgi:outer membrane protein assembly factor BamB